MVHDTFSSVNLSAGLQEIPLLLNTVTDGMFSYMLFGSVFLITLLTSYGYGRAYGKGDIGNSFAYSSVVTLIVATVFRIVVGMVSPTVYWALVAASAISVVYLLVQKDQN